MNNLCKQAVEALRREFIIKKNVHPIYYKLATREEIEAVLKPFFESKTDPHNLKIKSNV